MNSHRFFTARVKSSKKKFQLRKKKDIKNLETGITARFSTIHQNEEEKLKISRILPKEPPPSPPIQRRSVSTESLDVFFLFTIEFSCSFSFFLFSSNRQFFLGPDDRQRLHKIGMKTDKEKEKREKEQQQHPLARRRRNIREQKPCRLTRALCVTSCIENPYLRVPVILGSIVAPVFHVSLFSPRFRRELGPSRKEERKERFPLSLYLAYFFASIARCISRVVECKLLRAWGWFTANWFVNVVFTPLETPIFLPFLSAVLASVRGEKLQGSVVTWPSLLASSSRITRL